MTAVAGTLVDAAAAGLALVGIGLVVVGTYLGGAALTDGLVRVAAGLVCLGIGVVTLVRRDSELSDRLTATVRELFLST